MTTLVIHAPYRRVKNGAKSFNAVLASGLGDAYIITPREFTILGSSRSASVVVLDKDNKGRAEGVLVKLVPTKKAKNGGQRYDVHIRDLKTVPYKSERLNRNGIAVM